MKSMIGYIIVLAALAGLSLVDLRSAESSQSRTDSAYYSEASLGRNSFSSSSSHAKTKEQKREIAAAASNERLAVWPERVLKVKQRNFLLAQAFAVKTENFKKEMGHVLLKRGNFTVFTPFQEGKFDGFTVSENKFPVVVGEVDGELGVVTGNVILKVTSPEVAGLVASLVKSEIVSVNDSANTATLRLPIGQDLNEVIHTIRNYAGVESADFQIVLKGS